MPDDLPQILQGNGGAYVRVASIAIAAYEYVQATHSNATLNNIMFPL